MVALNMAIDRNTYQQILEECRAKGAGLVAVSKIKPVQDIMALYELGQRDFGENYVQELVDKQAQLPQDIRWHFIGHLQTNKVKQLLPFVHLIQGIDSARLLQETSKQAGKLGKTISCLLQVHIAQEDTKFGFDEDSLEALWGDMQVHAAAYANVRVAGFMGMASFSDNPDQVRGEFRQLKALADKYLPSGILSMGMSGDYHMALEEGSTLIRVGSLLFGAR